MRPTQPRVPPLDEAAWSERQRELLTRLQPRRVLNIFRTLAHHPDLLESWGVFGTPRRAT